LDHRSKALVAAALATRVGSVLDHVIEALVDHVADQ